MDAKATRPFPRGVEVQASAPCRVDVGGTWDLPALALAYEWNVPITANIALDLRTHVSLAPYRPGKVLIESMGFNSAKYDFADMPFSTSYSVICHILSHFGIHGVHVRVHSKAPPRSGLGGSGALAVALIGALSKVRAMFGALMPSRSAIALLAHEIECSLGVNGLQDQLAAAYGGANYWTWRYGNRNKPFTRTPLFKASQHIPLENSILVAHTGQQHSSTDRNQRLIDTFLDGSKRAIWLKINQCTHGFVRACNQGDLSNAANYIQEESRLRASIVQEQYSELEQELLRHAEATGCGGRTAGSGGGCIWALGPDGQIQRLQDLWRGCLSKTEGELLQIKPDKEGLVLY